MNIMAAVMTIAATLDPKMKELHKRNTFSKHSTTLQFEYQISGQLTQNLPAQSPDQQKQPYHHQSHQIPR
jgi:hypothetical protein